MTGTSITAKGIDWYCLLALVVVSFAVVLPVILQGLPYGYDLPHHYQCVHTFVESIRSDDFYPSWSLNRNFGYGGMETRLYPPVAHYTLALLYLLTGTWNAASLLTLLFFTFLGCLGVYLWTREYSSPWEAVFAGSVFAFLPYHLNQIYNTFFYAEYAGTAILPFSFVFLSRVCRRNKMSDVIGLGFSLAALVLTHLPLTVIGAICLVFYGSTLLRRGDMFFQLTRIVGGIALGLAGSAFFWVKVMQERDFLAKTLVYPDDWLDYRLHFLVTPLQHFQTGLQSSIYETATFFYDLMFLCAVVLAIAFSIPFLKWASGRFRALKGVIIVFLLSCFLITPASTPVWDHLPVLQEVQFPWRWIAVVSITAPVIASAGLKPLLEWYRTNRRPYALMITGCLLAILTFSISQIIRQAPFIPKAEVESRIENVATEKGFTFWWTLWARKEAFDVNEKILAVDRTAVVQKWDSTYREFLVTPGEPEEVRVAVFYHPNWHAVVNGTAVSTSPGPDGALLIPLSREMSDVRVSFIETRLVQFAQTLSILFWLSMLAFALGYLSRAMWNSRQYRTSMP